MSENGQRQNGILVDVIRVYLPLFIAIIGAAVTWGVFSEKINNLEDRISRVETQQDKNDTLLSDMQQKLTRIETILEERLPAKE